jgi:glycosyltransferase involved in cell wall biosynthesis
LTVPYGVDFDRAEELRHDAARDDARRALGIEADEELLLTIGPIVPAKCQSQLVGAFARIAGRWPKATLVLLGDGPGPYASALRDRVALSELRDRVRFEPVAADLAAWYLAADWLVVPSDIESMPRTVVEALAFVLPVAATSVGGVPDLIEDGASGLLCRARDTSAMIAMLERALSMSIDDRRRLAAAGAARARPYHDPQACADAYADCLLGAVRAGRAA